MACTASHDTQYSVMHLTQSHTYIVLRNIEMFNLVLQIIFQYVTQPAIASKAAMVTSATAALFKAAQSFVSVRQPKTTESTGDVQKRPQSAPQLPQ